MTTAPSRPSARTDEITPDSSVRATTTSSARKAKSARPATWVAGVASSSRWASPAVDQATAATMIATRPFLVARRSFGTVIPAVKHDVMSSRWETRSEAVDRAGRRPSRHRGRVRRPRPGARARGDGPRRDPSRDRRAGLRDAAARRRGRDRRDPCRRDPLLPDGGAPGPARGGGQVACRLARRRDRSRERRRRDRRQAVSLLHGARDLWPGRRGDLPRSGLPDLRVGGSLRGRDAGAAAAPRGARLQLRPRRARGSCSASARAS